MKTVPAVKQQNRRSSEINNHWVYCCNFYGRRCGAALSVELGADRRSQYFRMVAR